MVAPVFIDAAGAAEMLHVTIDAVLDLIREGTLPAFGGKPNNPFVRSRDVAALAPSIRVDQPETGARRVKSASAKVQTRLTADARWGDIAESDIREWALRADRTRRQAARIAATAALASLQAVLRTLDELDA